MDLFGISGVLPESGDLLVVELVAGDLLPTPELVAPLRVVQPLPLDLQVRLVAPGSVQINV